MSRMEMGGCLRPLIFHLYMKKSRTYNNSEGFNESFYILNIRIVYEIFCKYVAIAGIFAEDVNREK